MIKMKIRRWLLEAVSDRWTGVNLLILIICLKILSHHHHCNDDQDHYGDAADTAD